MSLIDIEEIGKFRNLSFELLTCQHQMSTKGRNSEKSETFFLMKNLIQFRINFISIIYDFAVRKSRVEWKTRKTIKLKQYQKFTNCSLRLENEWNFQYLEIWKNLFLLLEFFTVLSFYEYYEQHYVKKDFKDWLLSPFSNRENLSSCKAPNVNKRN